MSLPLYQVDAFTDHMFGGNPAAVCLLRNWLPDALMQNIAMENNLAETAFVVKKEGRYEIRWFTPAVEVDLCGHATLASAYVCFHHAGHEGNVIEFHSPRSGRLSVSKMGDLLVLDFPADAVQPAALTEELKRCFDFVPMEVYKGKTDYLFLYQTEDQIRKLIPDIATMKKVKGRGIIATAPGDKVDFVSRFFGPQVGIDEDPVTGSAHTTLTPFWTTRLAKRKMSALQLSKRGGSLQCELLGDRVAIGGVAKLYMVGEIRL